MIDENGEKMACEPCIRGHRVSGCNHKDRQLKHVAKKGRPVSQCVHCRALRKNRASHVKCECGDKGHKAEDCPHLLEMQITEHVCCCSHGKRCTCALKKDPTSIDEVPEEDGSESGGCCSVPQPAKPRIATQHSEGHTTVFANGHHKPVHNKNHEATHNRAQPYRVPHRPHSIHGHQALSQQRSMDHLRLSQIHTPASINLGALDQRENQYVQQVRKQERSTKSENVSPAPYGRQRSRTWQNPNLQAVEFSTAFDMSSPTSPLFPNLGGATAFVPNLTTGFSMNDDHQPLSAASEAPHVDWTGYEIPGPQYYSGVHEGYMTAPTSMPNMQRAASSSGAVSEYDYQPQYAISNPGYSESNYAQSNADISRPDIFRVESTPSFVHHHNNGNQASYFPETHGGQAVPPGLEMDARVPGSTTSLSEIDRSSSGTGSPAREVNGGQDHHQMPTLHGFSVEDAQKLAHPAARAVSAVNYDALAQPASPWSHEIHGENLPTFHPGNGLGGSNDYAFDEDAWATMRQGMQ